MTISEHQHARVAIVGGSGKVAREIIVQLHARGDEAVAIFRNPDRFDSLADVGAVPVVLDIEKATVGELADVFAAADVVVFSAGAGGGDPARTRAVDYDGAVTAIAAAELAHVSHFVMVSAIGAGTAPTPDAGDMLTYYQAKHDADVALTESSLSFTILRPGGLTDAPATGRVELADAVTRGSIPRADVAALVLAVIDDRRSVGHAWEAVSGTVAIADAVAAAL